MASQSTGSSSPGSGPVIIAAGQPGHFLLHAFKWMVSNSRFLYALAFVLVGSSFVISFHTDAWHWFQRSGALLVSIGAMLSTRHALGLMLDSMIDGRKLLLPVHVEEATASEAVELQACVCGFLFVAMGTFIWAYGDLLGCLLSWELSCLS
ncbi:MAG: hypothetical protein GY875_05455 [Gammaproteobacteria bacterium]|nr:hypothetical protein [Gammaproteobacteria bacterium]